MLPFKCLSLTAKILLRRLWCQEDVSFKPFGPVRVRGTLGGGGPSQPPPPL